MADLNGQDYMAIEAVLYTLWAPTDVDPARRIFTSTERTATEANGHFDDETLTVGEVLSARQALDRIRRASSASTKEQA